MNDRIDMRNNDTLYLVSFSFCATQEMASIVRLSWYINFSQRFSKHFQIRRLFSLLCSALYLAEIPALYHRSREARVSIPPSTTEHCTSMYKCLLTLMLNRQIRSESFSVHSPQYHFNIPLIISDRRDWRDTRGKCPLAKNQDLSGWHRHTNWTFFFFFATAHGSIDNR